MTFAGPILLTLVLSPHDDMHHMSAAYRTLGSATVTKSHLVYLGVMPQVGFTILLICATHLVPFLWHALVVLSI